MNSSFIQIIRDTNLNDSQVMTVLAKLKKHWKGGFPTYVKQALRDKKRVLDGLYSLVSEHRIYRIKIGIIFCCQVKLDTNTEYHFTEEVKGEEDKILTR